jgi:ketosteroid isomerase-like protein
VKKIILMSSLTVLLTAAWKTEEQPVPAMADTINTPLLTLKNTQMENQESNALEVVNRLFAAFKAGASHTEPARFYDEKAEMYIPGDTKNIPWIGRRTGRKQIADHYRLLWQNIESEKLDVTDILTKGNRVVILGYLESRYKGNNKLIKSEFSINIVVENGLITRYHFLEDSFEVSVVVKE